MDSDFPPGVVGVADDVLDLSGTVWTFHDHSAVHVDRTQIFNRALSAIASEVLTGQDGAGPNAYRQIVAQASGPQFESRADVEAFHRLGATCANMTIGGETRCMSEKTPPLVGLLQAIGRQAETLQIPMLPWIITVWKTLQHPCAHACGARFLRLPMHSRFIVLNSMVNSWEDQ